MFDIYAQCDWCKKFQPVTTLKYIDGKTNRTCQDCYDIAQVDIRLFNQAEQYKHQNHYDL